MISILSITKIPLQLPGGRQTHNVWAVEASMASSSDDRLDRRAGILEEVLMSV